MRKRSTGTLLGAHRVAIREHHRILRATWECGVRSAEPYALPGNTIRFFTCRASCRLLQQLVGSRKKQRLYAGSRCNTSGRCQLLTGVAKLSIPPFIQYTLGWSNEMLTSCLYSHVYQTTECRPAARGGSARDTETRMTGHGRWTPSEATRDFHFCEPKTKILRTHWAPQ